MATRRELQQLARLRLTEAEALYVAGCYDGCAYLCGYIVESALKAAVCATLGIDEYPDRGSRLRDSFRTHDFDDLKLLAGMEQAFTKNPVILANWSVASKWKPERRYETKGDLRPSCGTRNLGCGAGLSGWSSSMYIFTLVADVRKVIEALRAVKGEFKLAMLYNLDLDANTNWNLIISSDWTDALGTSEATKLLARELHNKLGLENRTAISRITVLKTSDPFVRDMVRLYPMMSPGGGVPLKQVTAGGVTEGAGFVFYSQPEVPV